MAADAKKSLATALSANYDIILQRWLEQQENAAGRKTIERNAEVVDRSRQFLTEFVRAIADGSSVDIGSNSWRSSREFLENLSRNRARQGFSPTETALFIFSLKETVFHVLNEKMGAESKDLAASVLFVSQVLDGLGLYTTEVYQQTREEIISRQQQELLELSTPVVKLWDEVLALPLIGTLDSSRTQVVMESLLQEIVQTGAAIAIIDITGVPTVDTLVAQHLLKTVAAARLMGADCIISGIRPQIAQTIVHLGVELNDVTTKATLADAFALALARTGKTVVRMKDKQAAAAQMDSLRGQANRTTQ